MVWNVIQVAVTPLSGSSLEFTVRILPCSAGDSPHPEQAANEKPTHQRQQLSLAPRSKPVASNWDMGAGGNQWGRLNVDADRKKKRCAECTRPLPLTCTSLLCERCTTPERSGQPQGTVASAAAPEDTAPSVPASAPPLKASPFKTAAAAPLPGNAMPPGFVLPSSNPASVDANKARSA